MKIPVEIQEVLGPNLSGSLVNILVSAGSATKVPLYDIFLIFERPTLTTPRQHFHS